MFRFPAYLRPLTAPLGALYGFFLVGRNALFDSVPGLVYRSRLPVLSVGNISLGGTGKTPLVRYLVELLCHDQEQPVVLMRGYGGAAAGPIAVSDQMDASVVGDEAISLKRSGVDRVVVSRRRVAGSRWIESNDYGSVIVLDDGFQHRWLSRCLNIVCIDCSSAVSVDRFISGRVVPDGLLREPLAPALQRADVFVLSARAPEINSQLEVRMRNWLPSDKPCFVSRVVGFSVHEISTGKDLEPQPVVALSGIANPGGFHCSLAKSGFVIREKIVLRDHARISEQVIKTASRHGVPVVITDKDAARLSPPYSGRLAIARIGIELSDPDKFIVSVRGAISKCRSEIKQP